MRYINKIEKTLSLWHRGFPHLPKRAHDWIVENMWWMALATVIILVSGLFLLIPLLFTALALAPTVNIATPYVPYYHTVLGLTWVGLTVFVASFLAAAVLVSLAVSMLREKMKRGWDLAFYALLASSLLNIIGAALMYSPVILVNVIVSALVGYYLLFEIRDMLPQRHKPVHKKIR